MPIKPVSAQFLKTSVILFEARKAEEAKKLKDDFFQQTVRDAMNTAESGGTQIHVEYNMATIQPDENVEIPGHWSVIKMTYTEFLETLQELFPGCNITKGQTPLKSTWCLTIDWS